MHAAAAAKSPGRKMDENDNIQTRMLSDRYCGRRGSNPEDISAKHKSGKSRISDFCPGLLVVFPAIAVPLLRILTNVGSHSLDCSTCRITQRKLFTNGTNMAVIRILVGNLHESLHK